MSALKKAIRLLILPFRIAWMSVKVVGFLISSVLCLWLGAFVAYWVALTFSYTFLPDAWTEAMWAWASGLYDRHLWFRVATIAPFALLVGLPFAFLKDGRTPQERRREEEERHRQLNDDLAAQQFREGLGLPR
ncbi:hypothetical protein [Mesorhizobium sp. M0276]|uniref:hypothetical protein n=1 Tax=Mesorhizobium sp. M0276 TaxID=2956928 RepID=UPI00333A7081